MSHPDAERVQVDLQEGRLAWARARNPHRESGLRGGHLCDRRSGIPRRPPLAQRSQRCSYPITAAAICAIVRRHDPTRDERSRHDCDTLDHQRANDDVCERNDDCRHHPSRGDVGSCDWRRIAPRGRPQRHVARSPLRLFYRAAALQRDAGGSLDQDISSKRSMGSFRGRRKPLRPPRWETDSAPVRHLQRDLRPPRLSPGRHVADTRPRAGNEPSSVLSQGKQSQYAIS